jgi:hypothetical protein
VGGKPIEEEKEEETRGEAKKDMDLEAVRGEEDEEMYEKELLESYR